MREKQQKTPYETYLSSNVAACLTKMFTSFKSHFWVCVVNEIVRVASLWLSRPGVFWTKFCFEDKNWLSLCTQRNHSLKIQRLSSIRDAPY